MVLPKKDSGFDEVALLASGGILGQLALQLDNFRSIRGFIKEHGINSGTLLLPQTLMQFDAELIRNSTFVYECLTFLDCVRMLSIAEYGDPSSFLTKVAESIVYNRVVGNFELTLGKATTNNLIFSTPEEAHSLIDSNKLIVSVYLYAVISTIFYK